MYPTILQGYTIHHLERVDSTNNYAAILEKRSNVQHKTVILTSFQESGRGQHSNSWQSLPGLNLLMSLYIKPEGLLASDQFLLSRVTALAICDCLSELLDLSFKIKWPNDIFIDELKVAGILIENSLKEKEVDRSIIGVGLNVNQESFERVNATSMKILAAKEWSLLEVLDTFLACFDRRYNQIHQPEKLHQDFDRSLRFYKEWHIFKKSKVGPFEGQILGTSKDGELIVEDEFHRPHHFQHKEISLN